MYGVGLYLDEGISARGTPCSTPEVASTRLSQQVPETKAVVAYKEKQQQSKKALVPTAIVVEKAADIEYQMDIPTKRKGTSQTLEVQGRTTYL